MATNFGPMHFNPIEIPAVPMFKVNEDDPDVIMIPAKTVWQLANADDIPWKDVDKGGESPDDWYIIADQKGFIMCCEKDPTAIGLPGYDVLKISHPGPREAIFTKFWNGKEVVDDNGQS